MRAFALVLAIAAALAWPAAGVANGDPASDTLLVRDIFFSYEGISTGAENAATDAVNAAKKRGYTIRMAVIASKTDLGLLFGLWRKPQEYATFLWKELSLPGVKFGYTGRLLVVMPNGFGYYDKGGRGVRAVLKKISGIKIGSGPDGLAIAGANAVRRLAGIKGSVGGGGTATRDRILIAAGSTVLIVALAYLTSRMYRRRVVPS